MKKGFTLIELLAVIIILAIVALIATPIVLDVVDDARTSAAKSETSMIVSGINNYCATAEMKAQMNNTTSECEEVVTVAQVAKMVDLGNAKVLEITYDKKLTYLKIESNGKIVEYDGRTYKIDGEVVETEPVDPTPTIYKDKSGANYPELLDNMIPVKYVDGNWVYADVKEKWYDYDAKEWANAVVLNSGVTKAVNDPISEDDIALMYVWIPRYTYTIFNGNNESIEPQVINIKFENGTNSNGTVACQDVINQTNANGDKISETCTDTTNGSVINNVSTYTHPAFTFGEDDLKGFWVGKFEVSGSTTQITIKPNVDSLRNQKLATFFDSVQNMTSIYGLNGDSHIIKNMEWGAVAYLKQSKYGLGITDIGINNYYDNGVYKTGCGAVAESTASTTCIAYNDGGEVASTTGNVYGVYDMSGGAHEYVMANQSGSQGAFYSSEDGFSTPPEKKYYDSYVYNSNPTKHASGKLGDATKESLEKFGDSYGGWTKDSASPSWRSYVWLMRGSGYDSGASAGIFSYTNQFGGKVQITSTRAVLVK